MSKFVREWRLASMGDPITSGIKPIYTCFPSEVTSLVKFSDKSVNRSCRFVLTENIFCRLTRFRTRRRAFYFYYLFSITFYFLFLITLCSVEIVRCRLNIQGTNFPMWQYRNWLAMQSRVENVRLAQSKVGYSPLLWDI